MFRVAIKGIRAHKLRLLTTGLAVLLGVAFMAGTMVLTDTIKRTFSDLWTDVNAGTDAYVRAEKAFENQFGEAVRPRVDATLVEQVAAVEGVEEAYGDILGFAQLVGSDGEPIGDPGMGAPTYGFYWNPNSSVNPMNLVEGRAPEQAGEVVIDRKSARDGNLQVGDLTTVNTQAGATQVRVVGIAKFGSADSPGGASITAFTLDDAQRLVAQPGMFDGITVVARDGVTEAQVLEQIAATLPAGTEVVGRDVLNKESQDAVEQGLAFFGTFMLAFAVIALFVGSFIIYNTFSIIVAQRVREMALLRAIGASRRQVLGSVLVEAVVIGLVASVVGLLAGVGVAGLLKAMLAAAGFDIPAGGIVLTSGTVIASIVTGVTVTLAAAFFPARKGAKVPPIAAMREVALERVTGSKTRLLLGTIVTAVGLALLFTGLFAELDDAVAVVGAGVALTFLGVTALGPLLARPATGLLGIPLRKARGVTGALARENAMRNPKRTSRTAAALMIGVALVGFITIVSASVKGSIDKVMNDQFTGDLVIDSGTFGFGGLSPQLAEELRGLDQLEAVAAVRVAPVQLDGRDTSLVAIDPRQMPELTDIGLIAGALTGLDATGLAVSEDRAEREGWELGSTVPIRFIDGLAELEVRAIYTEEALAGSLFVGLPVFDTHVTDLFDSQIYARVAAGHTLEQARAAVDEVAAAYPTAEVQDRAEFIDAAGAQIDQMVNLMYALLALAVLIAALGIANTLALSIVERTRELGLLRAVGMTRAQLRAVVRWEAVLIALFGTAGGVLIGVFFGWGLVQALADEAVSVFAVPAGQITVIAALAVLVGIAAAVLPARRAARLDVLRAIASE